jgi:hypothetical protein
MVQHLMGHASIQLTLDRYSHWIPSMGRATAEGMDEALGQLLLPSDRFEVHFAYVGLELKAANRYASIAMCLSPEVSESIPSRPRK